jgi:outer membrane protein assembly factor BamB
VIDLHDFVTKNMGLPFVFDTSSGLAVWNYPVNQVRIDRVKDVERTEDGKPYSYTSYRLRFTTMGGPTGDARYLIKRDARGNAIRALALDPMPDFAYRNEYWVCAPVTTDLRGEVAYNASALGAGYLTDKQRRQLVPDLWRRQAALCYASLAAPGGGDTVYAFERSDGEIFVFADAAALQAAIDADARGPAR